ncbi:MAG: aldehyde ferredoxin oxidoreductase family protein [Acidilobaceae archaeon]
MSDWVKEISNVLYVDLSRKTFWSERREDLFSKWLGGIGVAVQLYKEETPKDADPLSAENTVVLAIGPLTTVFPMGSKVISVFKSPLTGTMAESHAGGRAPAAIRFAGLGAIVIKGRSERPVYLVIDGERVRFRDAGTLWGMRSAETVGRVLREAVPGAGLRTIMRIGRAGERLVRYANVIIETYRHFGRMGLGAVFGSKKLKAVVVIGRRSSKMPKIREYRQAYAEVLEVARGPATKKYHDLGTAANVLPLNKLGALPTRNFLSGRFEGAENISGEKLLESLSRRLSCVGCPVACIHLAAIREQYEDEKYFYKVENVPYDYELLYSLGSNLSVGDTVGMLKLIRIVEEEGLDAISAGVALAWATEALERGIVTREQTLVDLKWGDWQSYAQALKYIVEQPNDFYKALAGGVKVASSKYGGADFAIEYNGLEPAGYHTGPLFHLSLAIGGRHSHLDAGAYGMDEGLASAKAKPPEPEEAVKTIAAEEAWRQVLNSLAVCLFGRKVYSPSLVAKALRSLGYETSERELEELGRRIYAERHMRKLEEGFRPEGVRIAKRVLETPTPLGNVSEEYIRRGIAAFKEMIERHRNP